ncbi:MAG TPA: hypothetical protein VNM39_13465, partial [Verrucomicrobiae bacterium]|nr:hypothetical protein [Verrucomicrobiae bacterium]
MRRLALGLAFACAVPLVAEPARATITPDAAKVVHRYLEVTGGAASFAAESTSYTHAKLYAFGFEGTFASWFARPSRRYARTELGPFKLSEGVNGATAWRTDPTTGVVRALADHDLDQALASAWFEGERWAEAGEGGGSVSRRHHRWSRRDRGRRRREADRIRDAQRGDHRRGRGTDGDRLDLCPAQVLRGERHRLRHHGAGDDFERGE